METLGIAIDGSHAPFRRFKRLFMGSFIPLGFFLFGDAMSGTRLVKSVKKLSILP